MPKNDLPLYFEELKIKEDSALTLSDLLAQIKQQIPVNYLEINLEEGNYGGSTNPKWKNKPLSERYFFTYQEKEIQLDLPHSLMDKLGLKKGEDIIQPLYLDPQVLTRTETYKGITLQEGEIILVNPHKITLKDQAIQTDLSRDGIKALENTIAKQSEQIQAKDREITDLRNQLSPWTLTFPNENANQVQTRINSLNSQINQKNTQINTLQTNYNNADNRANNLQTQLTTANAELVREKGWWDEWINDSGKRSDPNDRPFIFAFKSDMVTFSNVYDCYIFLNKSNSRNEDINISNAFKKGFLLCNIPIESRFYDNFIGNIKSSIVNLSSDMKKEFKNIYQYYRDK